MFIIVVLNMYAVSFKLQKFQASCRSDIDKTLDLVRCDQSAAGWAGCWWSGLLRLMVRITKWV